jgi:hypothetical protein
MKTIALTAAIAAFATSIAICEAHNPYFDEVSALPLLAGVCDIIGIGEMESTNGTNAIINVSQYWFGAPQTNLLEISVHEYATPPSA